jgi:hypothetical protein
VRTEGVRIYTGQKAVMQRWPDSASSYGMAADWSQWSRRRIVHEDVDMRASARQIDGVLRQR